MILHTEVDIGDAEELDHLLDALELTEEQEWVIGVSALRLIERLADALTGAVTVEAPAEP